jgi:hypothetical protein
MQGNVRVYSPADKVCKWKTLYAFMECRQELIYTYSNNVIGELTLLFRENFYPHSFTPKCVSKN